jgi:hypothetical protein
VKTETVEGRGARIHLTTLDPEDREAVAKALEDTITDFAEAVLDEAVRNAPVDRGTLRKSARIDYRREKYKFTARIGFYTPYAATKEYGRRPGAKPPPIKPIREWAGRHGIPKDAAYPIARAIGKRGLKGSFFLHRAAKRVRDRFKAQWPERFGRWLRFRWPHFAKVTVNLR